LPRAAGLAAELQRHGAAVEVKPGARGAFEVHIDGRLVFSKLQSGRFPDDREIVAFLGV
jgi:selT/selW/selH-like putative selenoprotein